MMRSVANIQEEDSDDSSMKEREERWIKENTEFELSSLRLRIIGKDSNEAVKTKEMTAKTETSDSNATFINTQGEGNHPLGKLSSGHDDHGANTHDLCKRETDMRTELTDYSLTPPELTDS